ncbi:uncharacterized protein LOC143651804 [Tamandua tetradactyla]|uniref:uncharacterized protein LOC143651804 n=1 Tax=Tamandua tetradactyla TaxID=48850 RepID=UPI0040542A84
MESESKPSVQTLPGGGRSGLPDLWAWPWRGNWRWEERSGLLNPSAQGLATLPEGTVSRQPLEALLRVPPACARALVDFVSFRVSRVLPTRPRGQQGLWLVRVCIACGAGGIS